MIRYNMSVYFDKKDTSKSISSYNDFEGYNSSYKNESYADNSIIDYGLEFKEKYTFYCFDETFYFYEKLDESMYNEV